MGKSRVLQLDQMATVGGKCSTEKRLVQARPSTVDARRWTQHERAKSCRDVLREVLAEVEAIPAAGNDAKPQLTYVSVLPPRTVALVQV